MASRFLRGLGPMRVIGHRGALALAPENTLAAFAAGERCGVDAIEFDVQRSADGVPVVIHDHTLDRTTNGRGAVSVHTFAEIRSLDAGSHFDRRFAGERVPSLDELLTWAAPRTVGLMLELKQPSPGTGLPRDAELARATVELVRERGLLSRTIFISFDHPSLAKVLEFEPRADVGLLTEGPILIDPLAPARALPGARGLHVRWWWVTSELCEAAHAAGMHVHAWGFGRSGTSEVIHRLASWGVDSLSADAPDELLALLKAERLRP
jgi:glycerophosphoryl diester phosphodiesterase